MKTQSFGSHECDIEVLWNANAATEICELKSRETRTNDIPDECKPRSSIFLESLFRLSSHYRSRLFQSGQTSGGKIRPASLEESKITLVGSIHAKAFPICIYRCQVDTIHPMVILAVVSEESSKFFFFFFFEEIKNKPNSIFILVTRSLVLLHRYQKPIGRQSVTRL